MSRLTQPDWVLFRFVFVWLLGSAIACGQLAEDKPTSGLSSEVAVAQADWDALVGEFTLGSTAGSGEGKVSGARNDWRSKADSARAFLQNHPKHHRAVAAQKMEAEALLHAVFGGDVSLQSRRDKATSAFIGDLALPERERAEVAGLAGFYEVLGSAKEPAAIWADFEAMARRLIKAFPSQPQGYESLLTVANSVDDPLCRNLALELTSLDSPSLVRKRATSLVRRLALVGQSLGFILKSIPQEALSGFVSEGRPAVIYSWSEGDQESLQLAEKLVERVGGRAALIGLNLDADPSGLGLAAEGAKLGEHQIYAVQRGGAAVAEALAMDEAALLLIIDKYGIIRDVRGYRDLEQKLDGISP